jgi:sugar/nucleoside kinase (ribokinase family)
MALVAADGERTFVTDRGVADSLATSDLSDSWFARADALHLPTYSLLRAPLSAACLAAAEKVRARGGFVSVDLASRAPLLAAGADHGLRAVRAVTPDILFANIDEVAALVGRRGARRLLDVAPVVVVKIGAGGCQVLWRAGSDVLQVEVGTKPIAAADTTGAGDAFDAGFLYAVMAGGFRPGSATAALLRRAALSGHKAAASLLTRPRAELAL